MPTNQFGDEVEVAPKVTNQFGDEVITSKGTTPLSAFDKADPAEIEALVKAGSQKRRKDADQQALFNLTPLARAETTMGDILNVGMEGATAGLSKPAIAGARSLFGGTYDEEREAVERRMEAAHNRLGPGATPAEVTGAVVSPINKLKLAGEGASFLGRTAGEAIRGALYGTGHAVVEGQDVLKEGATGAMFGAGGQAIGEGLAKGATALSKGLQSTFLAAPDVRAQIKIYKMAQDMGLTPQDIQRRVAELGPEAFTADILERSGTREARAAANKSPEAQGILETALKGRKDLQNVRTADTLTDTTGLPRGTRQTTEQLTQSIDARNRPRIDQLYEQARLQGHDLPYTPFEDILKTPEGSEAYAKAERSLLNRLPVQGSPQATSQLARLDKTQRLLRNKARMASRAGDDELAGELNPLSVALRQRLDEQMVGPMYEQARGAAQRNFQEQGAVELGEQAAGMNLSSSLPAEVATARAAHPEAVSQAYALQMQQNLLNKQSTAGALNRMNTPLGEEAAAAALGPEGAADLARRLEAERVFNQTNSEIVGNSTTARQTADLNRSGPVRTALEAGGGALAGGMLSGSMGFNPTIPALTGALAAGGRSGLSSAFRSADEAMAPSLARRLIGDPNDIPWYDPLAGKGEVSDAMRDRLSRLLGRGAYVGGQ